MTKINTVLLTSLYTFIHSQSLLGMVTLNITNSCGSEEAVECSPPPGCCPDSKQCKGTENPNFEFKVSSKTTLNSQTIDMTGYPAACNSLTCSLATWGDDSQYEIKNFNGTYTITLAPSTDHLLAPHCILTGSQTQ